MDSTNIHCREKIFHVPILRSRKTFSVLWSHHQYLIKITFNRKICTEGEEWWCCSIRTRRFLWLCNFSVCWCHILDYFSYIYYVKLNFTSTQKTIWVKSGNSSTTIFVQTEPIFVRIVAEADVITFTFYRCYFRYSLQVFLNVILFMLRIWTGATNSCDCLRKKPKLSTNVFFCKLESTLTHSFLAFFVQSLISNIKIKYCLFFVKLLLHLFFNLLRYFR